MRRPPRRAGSESPRTAAPAPPGRARTRRRSVARGRRLTRRRPERRASTAAGATRWRRSAPGGGRSARRRSATARPATAAARQVLGLVDRPAHPPPAPARGRRRGHAAPEGRAPRRASSRSAPARPRRAALARSGRSAGRLGALARARRSRPAGGRTPRARAPARPRSPRRGRRGRPAPPRLRPRAGARSRPRARSCAAAWPRAAPARDLRRDRGYRLAPASSTAPAISPTGSGTITAPSCRNVLPGSCGASSAGTVNVIRQVPGAAPVSEGGSGIAANRCRTVPVSTTSIACPRSSGRRRRQRPVTRTVTLRPPSATSSTASIPRAEGRSLIGRDGTTASGRQRVRPRADLSEYDRERTSRAPAGRASVSESASYGGGRRAHRRRRQALCRRPRPRARP